MSDVYRSFRAFLCRVGLDLVGLNPALDARLYEPQPEGPASSASVEGALGPTPGDFGPICTSGNWWETGGRCEGDAARP